MLPKYTRFSRKAFSLVEMLVVIAIVGILVTIIVIVFNNIHDKSESVVATSRLRTLVSAMNIYASDNNGSFPAPTKTLPNGNIAQNGESIRQEILVREGYIPKQKGSEALVNPTNIRTGQGVANGGYLSSLGMKNTFTARSYIYKTWNKPRGTSDTPLTIYSDLGVPIIWDRRADLYGTSLNPIRVDGEWAGHFAYPDGSVELLVYPDKIIRE